MKPRRIMAKPEITVQVRLDLESKGHAFAKLLCKKCKNKFPAVRISWTTSKRGFPCDVCNEVK